MKPARCRRLVLAVGLLVPADLAAQACLGLPYVSRGWVGGGIVRTSAHQMLTGVEAGVRAGRGVTILAEGDLVHFGDDQTPDRRRVGAGVAVGSRAIPVPVCLTLSGMITRLGDLTVVSVPVGVAVGWEIPLAGGATRIIPHVEARLGYQRASLGPFHRVTIPFSVGGGLGLARGRLFGGIDSQWAPAESRGLAAGLGAGVTF